MPRPVLTRLASGNTQSTPDVTPTPNALLLFGCTLREAATASPDITIAVTGLTGLTWTEIGRSNTNTATSLFMAVVPSGGAGTGSIQFTCTGTPSRPHYVLAEATALLAAALPTNTNNLNHNSVAAPQIALLAAPGPDSMVVAICGALGTSVALVPASDYTQIHTNLGGTTGFSMERTADASPVSQTAGWSSGGATAANNQLVAVELVGLPPVRHRASGSGVLSATSNAFTPDVGDTIFTFVGGYKNGGAPGLTITNSQGDNFTVNELVLGGAKANPVDPDTRPLLYAHPAPATPVPMTVSVSSTNTVGLFVEVFTASGLPPISGAWNADTVNATGAGSPSPSISIALAAIVISGFYGPASTAAATSPAGYTEIVNTTLASQRVVIAYLRASTGTVTAGWSSTHFNAYAWLIEGKAAVQAALQILAVDDTLGLSIDDVRRTMAVLLARSDSVSLALGDVLRTIPLAFLRSDSLNVGVSEVRTLKNLLARTDALNVGLADAGGIKSLLARSDQLNAGISEAGVTKSFLARVDSLNVGTTEGRVLKAFLARVDALLTGISEGTPVFFIDSGQIFKAVGDVLGLSISEARVLKALLDRSDPLRLQLGYEVLTGLVKMTRADAVSLAVAESRTLKGFSTRADALAVGIGGGETGGYGWSAASAVLPAGFTLTRASEGSFWSGGLIAFAPANTPRFEDILGGKGLLLEGEFTNIVPYAEDFTLWGPAGITVTGNVGTDPAGTTLADQLSIPAGFVYLSSRVGVPFGEQVTAACYFKQAPSGSATHGRMMVNNTAATNTGGEAKVALTGSWQRAVIPSWTQVGTNFADCHIGSFNTHNQNDPECIGNTLVWGYNLGLGSFPTSYVRTNGAAATRAADVLTRPVTLPAGGFTEVIEFITAGLPASGVVTVEHFGGGTNDLRVIIESGTLKLRTSFGMDVVVAAGIVANTRYRLGLVWTPTRRAASLGGAPVVSSGSSAGIDATQQALGSDADGSAHFHGYFVECNASGSVWRAPVSDADLRTLASGLPLSSGEVSSMKALLVRSDVMALQLAEARSILTKVQRTDPLALELAEAARNQTGRRQGDAAGIGLIETARIAVVQRGSDTAGISLVESARVVKIDATEDDRPWWTDVAGVKPGMDTAVEPELGTK